MLNADLPVHGAQLPRLISASGVQIREDVLSTDAKGEPDDRSRKRAEEALASLHDILPNLLEPSRRENATLADHSDSRRGISLFRYDLLGVLAFLSEGIFTLGVIFSVLMAVGLMPRETAENDQVMQPADSWGAALLFAVILSLNKALQYIHSRRVIRSFVPLKKT